MPDLIITYRDRHGEQQTKTHSVGDLSKPTIITVVDVFEGQIGTVLRVDCDGRNFYRLREPTRNTRLVS